jgi:hypothetical protein
VWPARLDFDTGHTAHRVGRRGAARDTAAARTGEAVFTGPTGIQAVLEVPR